MTIVASLALAAAALWLMTSSRRVVEPILFFVVLSSCGLALACEILGMAGALSLSTVRIGLLFAVAVAGLVAWRLRDRLGDDWSASAPKPPTVWTGAVRIGRALSLALLFALLAATAFTALASLPNNWDSMTYHLPRIEHWLQNGSLEFYPTAIVRQLDSGILAEEWILAVRSLADLESGANLVQWSAYAGCILLAGWIARDLGGGDGAAIVAMVLVATLPMAILQASSTQNDLVVAFYAAASLHFLLGIGRNGPPALVYGAVLAAALAFHTKGTAAILLFGFILVYGIQVLRRADIRRLWPHLAAALVLSSLVLGGQIARNVAAFGAPVGPESRSTAVAAPAGGAALYNLVRDAASHLVVTDAAQRTTIETHIRSLGEALGVDDSDPRYSFEGRPFELPPGNLHEDTAANPLHLALILAAALLLPILALPSAPWRRRTAALLPYGLALAMSVTAFAGLIKWQPWIARLQLGEFILAMPPVAVALAALGAAAPLALAALAVAAWPFAVSNQSRPLIGAGSIVSLTAEEQLFANRPALRAPYRQAVDRIVALKPRRIGLWTGRDGWEYPLWYLLRQRLGRQAMPVIGHELDVGAVDASADLMLYIDVNERPRLPVPGFVPHARFESLEIDVRHR